MLNPTPVRQRSSCLSGHGARLYRMYAGSVFGIRMSLAYFPDECVPALVEQLRRCAGLRPFDNARGERVRVRRFTEAERTRREVEGRMERGEQLDALSRRQAA